MQANTKMPESVLQDPIERQLGRKPGPKKIGRPKKVTTDADDMLESRL